MNAVHTWELVVFVILPYVCLTIFVVGHVWRYRFDQFGWTSRSSELYERKYLLFGSPVFHYGAILAILGHFAGLLIPESWTNGLGISEAQYSLVSKAGGNLAGILVLIGLLVLTLRRWGTERVRVVTTRVDVVAFAALWVMILLGLGEVLIYNTLGPGYDYRPTVSEWLRGIFTLHPDVARIASAPAVYQVHAAAGWLFLALFPFTRFVHFWSAPVWYLARPFVVYHRRARGPVLSPGESQAWRTVGGWTRDSGRR